MANILVADDDSLVRTILKEVLMLDKCGPKEEITT
jgi:CheY-like chemotaxis protein